MSRMSEAACICQHPTVWDWTVGLIGGFLLSALIIWVVYWWLGPEKKK